MDTKSTEEYFNEILRLPLPPGEEEELLPMRTVALAAEVVDPEDPEHFEDCELDLPPAPVTADNEEISAKEAKSIVAMTDVTSRIFNKKRYIATNFRDSNYEQLQEDVAALDDDVQDAHNTIRTTVHDNLETFIAAKREMETVYTEDAELFNGEATQQLLDDYSAAVDAVKTKETPLGKAGASIVNMFRVRSVFEKAQDFLTVPAIVYATCGAEVLPPLPDAILSGLGRSPKSVAATGGKNNKTFNDSQSSTEDETDSDFSTGNAANSDDDDDEEDGGISRLIAKHVAKDTFVFRDVLLKPIDFDGNAATRRSTGIHGSAPSSPSSTLSEGRAGKPADSSAAVNTSNTMTASSLSPAAALATTARSADASTTMECFMTLAKERNFEGAVIHIHRCILFLEDNYNLLTGRPKRQHSQEGLLDPNSQNNTKGSGAATTAAIQRRKQEAKMEARMRKRQQLENQMNGLERRQSAFRLTSLRSNSDLFGEGGEGLNSDDSFDDDDDEDPDDADLELEAILALGSNGSPVSGSTVGGIPKTLISAGDAPLPDEEEYIRQTNIERGQRLALYIAEKQFLFRFTTALLTSAIFLSECLYEEMTRSAADSDTIFIEDMLKHMMNVCANIAKLRNFAIQLRYQLRVAQPIKQKLHNQLRRMREQADGSHEGSSRGDYNDDDDTMSMSGFSHAGGARLTRSESFGESSGRGGGGSSDAESVASTVYDAEGQAMSPGRFLGSRRRVSGTNFTSSPSHTDQAIVDQMLTYSDELLGNSPSAFLKWRPTARGALRRPILHPVEAYLSILQQQHARSVQRACRIYLDPSIRVLKGILEKKTKAAEAEKRRETHQSTSEDFMHQDNIGNNSILGGGDPLKDSMVLGGANTADMEELKRYLLEGGGGGSNGNDAASSTSEAKKVLNLKTVCLPSQHALEAIKTLQASTENFSMSAIMRQMLTAPPSLGMVGAAILSSSTNLSHNDSSTQLAGPTQTSLQKNFGIKDPTTVLSTQAFITGLDITPIIAATTAQLAGEGGVVERCLRALTEGSESVSYYSDDYCSRNPPPVMSLLTQILLTTEKTILNYWCGIGSSAVHKGVFDFAPPPPISSADLTQLRSVHSLAGVGITLSEASLAAEAEVERYALASMVVTSATSNRTPFKAKKAKDAFRHDEFEEIDIDGLTETLQLHDRHLRNISEWLSAASRLQVYGHKNRIRLLSQGNTLRMLREVIAEGQQQKGGSNQSSTASTSAINKTVGSNGNKTLGGANGVDASNAVGQVEVLVKLLPASNEELAKDTHRIIPTCRFAPVSNLPQLLVAARKAQLPKGQSEVFSEDTNSKASPDAPTSLRVRSVATIRAVIRHMADSCIQILRATIGHSLADGLMGEVNVKRTREEQTIVFELVVSLWERLVLRICDSIIRLKASLVTPPPSSSTSIPSSTEPNAGTPSLAPTGPVRLTHQDSEDILLFVDDLEDLRARVVGIYMHGLGVAARCHVTSLALVAGGLNNAGSGVTNNGPETAYAVDDHFNPMTGSFRLVAGGTMGGTSRGGGGVKKSATYSGTSVHGATATAGPTTTAVGSQESQQQMAKADLIHNDRSLMLVCRLSRTWVSTEFPVIVQNLLYVLSDRVYDIILRTYETQNKQRNIFSVQLPTTGASKGDGGGGVNPSSFAGASLTEAGGMFGSSSSTTAALDPLITLHRAIEARNTTSINNAKDAFGALVVDVVVAGLDAVMGLGRSCGVGESETMLLSEGGSGDPSGIGGLSLTAAAVTLNNRDGLTPEDVLLIRQVRGRHHRQRRLMLSECIADVICLHKVVLPTVTEKILQGEIWEDACKLILQHGSVPRGDHEVKAAVSACAVEFAKRGGCEGSQPTSVTSGLDVGGEDDADADAPIFTGPSTVVGGVADLALTSLIDLYVSATRTDIVTEVLLHGFAHPNYDWQRHAFGFSKEGRVDATGVGSGVRSFVTDALTHVARAHDTIFRIQSGDSGKKDPTTGLTAEAQIGIVCLQVVQRLVAFIGKCILSALSAVGGGDTGGAVGMEFGDSVLNLEGVAEGARKTKKGIHADDTAGDAKAVSISFELFGLITLEAELLFIHYLLDRLRTTTAKVVGETNPTNPNLAAKGFLHPELRFMYATIPKVVAAIQVRGKAACEYSYNIRRFGGPAAAGCISLNPSDRQIRVEALLSAAKSKSFYVVEAICGFADKASFGAGGGRSYDGDASGTRASTLRRTSIGGPGQPASAVVGSSAAGAGTLASRLERQQAARQEAATTRKHLIRKAATTGTGGGGSDKETSTTTNNATTLSRSAKAKTTDKNTSNVSETAEGLVVTAEEKKTGGGGKKSILKRSVHKTSDGSEKPQEMTANEGNDKMLPAPPTSSQKKKKSTVASAAAAAASAVIDEGEGDSITKKVVKRRVVKKSTS